MNYETRFPLFVEKFGVEPLQSHNHTVGPQRITFVKVLCRIEKYLDGYNESFKRISRVEMVTFGDIVLNIMQHDIDESTINDVKMMQSHLNDQIWSEMK